MFAGILLRSFPVHHFRWRITGNTTSGNVISGDVISGDATSGDVIAPQMWPGWCIKKDTSDWFLGLIDRFFFGEKRSHWSIWIVALNSIFFLAGKFEFWREIWILVGILLRLFPVYHFRWRHFPWYNFRWCYFRWRHFRWCSFRWCHCSSPAPPQMRPGWCIYITGGA